MPLAPSGRESLCGLPTHVLHAGAPAGPGKYLCDEVRDLFVKIPLFADPNLYDEYEHAWGTKCRDRLT